MQEVDEFWSEPSPPTAGRGPEGQPGAAPVGIQGTRPAHFSWPSFAVVLGVGAVLGFSSVYLPQKAGAPAVDIERFYGRGLAIAASLKELSRDLTGVESSDDVTESAEIQGLLVDIESWEVLESRIEELSNRLIASRPSPYTEGYEKLQERIAGWPLVENPKESLRDPDPKLQNPVWIRKSAPKIQPDNKAAAIANIDAFAGEMAEQFRGEPYSNDKQFKEVVEKLDDLKRD